MIKDYIANSFHVDRDDFELDPFNKQGGLGKMWQLFGEETDEIINELNESCGGINVTVIARRNDEAICW